MQTKVSVSDGVTEAESGLVIERRFTSVGEDPFDSFEWIEMDVEIRNPDGSMADSIEGVKLPSGFSGVPGKVCAQKYLRKAGVPKALRKVPEKEVPVWLQRSEPDHERLQTVDAAQRMGGETDGRNLFRRLAGTWTYWGWKYGYFASEADARAYFDEMCYLIASQRSAPNSPQWFNTGLHWAYGIEGPSQGHSYVDPITEELSYSTNAYERPQPHACFIQSVSDSLVGGPDSIMGLWSREALLFKYGSGTGSNFSNIRGAGEPLSGGGSSSGLLSFLKIGDRAAGAIKSGGTTRRAAKMVTLDLDHPDIEEYIDWKPSEEEKVSALVIGSSILQKHANTLMDAIWEHSDDEGRYDQRINLGLRRAMVRAIKDSVPQAHIQRIVDLAKQGWKGVEFEALDTDWQGEAYVTVSGQNSNNSVRVPNSFMDAVNADGQWSLFWRTEKEAAAAEGRGPVPCRTLDANALWDKIAYTAWACADPGVQFDTTINEWHTCPSAGRINGSNPCSEYMFLDDTACNLASINLLHYYDLDAHTFRIEDFRHSVRLWTTTLEISVLMAQFPSESITRKSYEYRTLGLGYCNIGSLLMHMGIPYDDERAYAICGAITSIMCGETYATSAEMASVLGAFPDYERNAEDMLRVMRNHRRAAYGASEEEYEGLTVPPMGINAKKCPKDLLDAARGSWDRAVREGEEHGYRNAQTTVIAPTGTIGLVMGADTTGVEPQYSLVQFKTLAGGGSLRIINNGVPNALRRLGYSDSQTNAIEEYIMGTGRLSGCPTLPVGRLKDAGFTSESLKTIDSKLSDVFDLRSAFSPSILGKSLCTEALGMSESQFEDPFFDTLGSLGFTPEEVEAANVHIFGYNTIEGAPGLKDEHLAVFDCATPCGKFGKRSIAWPAHVKMMAAAQPFISGAISKTINMPSNSTVEDVREAYNLSHTTMNKACAVYRDGSKLSQPLMNQLVDTPELTDEDEGGVVERMVEETVKTLPLPEPVAKPVAEAFVKDYIAIRRPLPNRKRSENIKAKVGGHSVRLITGEYPDGKLGEIFLLTSKEGAAWRAMLSQFAIAVSIGLQHGVPIDAFVKSFIFSKFEPSGMIEGGSGRVKMSSSIVDWVFRELAIEYAGRDDLAHVAEEDLDQFSISKPEISDAGVVRSQGEKRDLQMTLEASVAPLGSLESRARQAAKERGFTGDICDDCGGSQMVRNGTCLKCNECGATTGCS
ncbi:MAG: adenosylcobalamin-dependent ribonucleoside-diphosphate reductase [Candidatus Thalassarchaeaceae archaeon]|jgi:ribonucleoside-diphosphate reductase alpha chain|nr:adenosylcobalamin-dependent ribonucleoside-diphosphate reductase [Candidatus Thalassarchaeaceae archaeon]MDP6703191.1 adenosylcobalamin-dependent ribonucleoside-diphosphate reductase [Candidatus Thalassarchaeaceae archaeon]MDP7003836.1 adenosylcobalamin-dependent ribonucleoside-diphosphate reductase [Candidatus Thalassarchaeaceae archaeon]